MYCKASVATSIKSDCESPQYFKAVGKLTPQPQPQDPPLTPVDGMDFDFFPKLFPICLTPS